MIYNRRVIKLFFYLFVLPLWASPTPSLQELHKFSGRISRVNQEAELVRLRVKFENIKFFTKNDLLELWSEANPRLRCEGKVMGKSNQYILLKVSGLKSCIQKIGLSVGLYVKGSSQDLKNNLFMAKELNKVLLKKRLAIQGILNRHKKNLETYPEKVQALNQRYDILRKKLNSEWQKELSYLEEDKINAQKKYSQILADLEDLDFKLEQYRIQDNNFVIDRWALDENLYIQK